MNVEAAQCKTIAFPVFGTGKLLYPWESVAKTMITTVQKYGRMHFETCVEEVRIVLYEKDLKSIEASLIQCLQTIMKTFVTHFPMQGFFFL